MKKRYLYALLFGIPGLFLAGILSIAFFGGLMGILWTFVFGDSSWPTAIEIIVSILFVLVSLVVWIGFLIAGYLIGRRLETDPVLNRNHVLISGALTLLFILLIALYQWNVGNLGPKSDSSLCSDFCTLHGFSASGVPPQNAGERMCSCFDEAGNETIRIPLDHLDPNFSK
jgi:hypothetical protein